MAWFSKKGKEEKKVEKIFPCEVVLLQKGFVKKIIRSKAKEEDGKEYVWVNKKWLEAKSKIEGGTFDIYIFDVFKNETINITEKKEINEAQVKEVINNFITANEEKKENESELKKMIVNYFPVILGFIFLFTVLIFLNSTQFVNCAKVIPPKPSGGLPSLPFLPSVPTNQTIG